jgi:2-polyprenyl-3-methyl-5-hydroxy-6-metoxy-1,4-benzoquinol methylase
MFFTPRLEGLPDPVFGGFLGRSILLNVSSRINSLSLTWVSSHCSRSPEAIENPLREFMNTRGAAKERVGLAGVDSGQAYDSLASRYDSLLLDNPVLAHSANVSLGLVKKTLASRQHILEIGCGTGRETLEIASLGKVIVACDPSKESLAVLRQKARHRGLSERIQT